MTAKSSPKKSKKWFQEFKDGLEFEVSDIHEAQEYLKKECQKAGTFSDVNYDLYGPIAIQKASRYIEWEFGFLN